jgi:transcriptional regulator with XRE-family HTH domain
MQEFARKLHTAMTDRGMTQSDLARAAFGTYVNADGYTVAKSRDRISVYLSGKALPDPKNLKALAEALGLPVEELAPPSAAATVDREAPSLALQAVPGRPGLVQLQLDMLLPLELAAKVMALLGEHEKSKAG